MLEADKTRRVALVATPLSQLLKQRGLDLWREGGSLYEYQYILGAGGVSFVSCLLVYLKVGYRNMGLRASPDILLSFSRRFSYSPS